MPQLVITCTLGEEQLGQYVFNCEPNVERQKTKGRITIHFNPVGDCHHQMVIDSLPSGQSKTIKVPTGEGDYRRTV